ncbi:MAG TPA: serine hydrolase [Dermatophilaceae bacterium]|jgi:beta-lactamase class A
MTHHRNEALETALADLAGRHTGNLGVAARDLITGEEVLMSADEVFPTASVIKLPVLVEFMRQAADGRLALDERVNLREEDIRGGSGILKVFDAGLQPTLRDIATLMIVLSDNTATNLVIDAVGGIDPVNTAMDELGLSTIRLHNRVDFDLIGSDVRRLGESSPRDMRALVQGIAERTVFGPEVSEAVERVLAGQQYLDQVPRYLQVSPYAAELGLDPEITVANKTGFFTGTRADAGIVRYRDGGGFAYAVFNHESKDETFLAESEGSVLAGLVGKALVEHWWPGGRDTAPTAATAYAPS